jgi:hypothetical protein
MVTLAFLLREETSRGHTVIKVRYCGKVTGSEENK